MILKRHEFNKQKSKNQIYIPKMYKNIKHHIYK